MTSAQRKAITDAIEKSSPEILALETEAQRFKQLAKDAALEAIIATEGSKISGYRQLAENHLLRAETIKAAATLIKNL
jgi:pheromone shutdown protein TraB